MPPVIIFLVAAAAFGQVPSPTLADVTTKVSEHIWITPGFPNVVYVVGDNATLVVDTGLGNKNGELVARIAKRLSKGPKLFLTTTHYHPEHAAGIGGFPPETVLIRPAVQQRELEKEGEQTVTFFRNSPQFGPSLQGLGPLRPPDMTFDTEAKLELGGGATARLMFLGAGHTASDELIFVEPDRALITGDIVQNKVVPSVASSGGSFASWLTVLDKLVPLRPRVVIPTHSKVGDASLITSEAAFIRDMQARATALKRSGVSAADAATRLTDVFKTNYPDWAANADWPNVNSMTGFVNRLYAEIRD
ncbi:MAG TPA: MBL fold metallo-hydrolase [Bryobacteraceae bacterium]|jgi:glyoxylase-like metal-dependent hydrolase (beta-lactamase superfamily II)|nr:MBL fold metallo-hydrolase [Bryobacteraceae bacterium]